jgi:three-Cys-motif partner protein
MKGQGMGKQLQMFGGDWTEQKLQILAQYLARYGQALSKQAFTRTYVDAFAGTGYREARRSEFRAPDLFDELQGEPLRFLKGSAKRALEVEPRFHRYVFVESDPAKADELCRLKAEHPALAQRIEIVGKDANEFVRQFCEQTDWRSNRAVVFLDPFATEVEWKTVEAIARTQAIDLWILLPLMAVNRRLANDPRKVWMDRLDGVFGTDEWFPQFYRERRGQNIFGQPLVEIQRICDYDRIGKYYNERLRSIFSQVAPSPRLFRNTRGAPLFQLFFAAGNPKGAPIAVRIASHLLERI